MTSREQFIHEGLSEADADTKAREILDDPDSTVREEYLEEMVEFARYDPDLYESYVGRSHEHSSIIGGIKVNEKTKKLETEDQDIDDLLTSVNSKDETMKRGGAYKNAFIVIIILNLGFVTKYFALTKMN